MNSMIVNSILLSLYEAFCSIFTSNIFLPLGVYTKGFVLSTFISTRIALMQGNNWIFRGVNFLFPLSPSAIVSIYDIVSSSNLDRG